MVRFRSEPKNRIAIKEESEIAETEAEVPDGIEPEPSKLGYFEDKKYINEKKSLVTVVHNYYPTATK